jgi:telomerase reverse transcriptase
LYSREKPGTWPKHLLCDGFKRRVASRAETAPAEDAIPGLFVAFPNHRVKTLKADPWPQLLMLLGKEGERIMIDLLVDHALFEPVQAGRDNLYQLSGVHIAELKTLAQEAQEKTRRPTSTPGLRPVELRPSEICFLRNRMLYARAALNAHGLVQFGLRHIRTCQHFRVPRNDMLTVCL